MVSTADDRLSGSATDRLPLRQHNTDNYCKLRLWWPDPLPLRMHTPLTHGRLEFLYSINDSLNHFEPAFSCAVLPVAQWENKDRFNHHLLLLIIPAPGPSYYPPQTIPTRPRSTSKLTSRISGQNLPQLTNPRFTGRSRRVDNAI